MVELATIVTVHGGEYLRKFGDRMPATHRRALESIAACRTEAMGGHLEACDDADCNHRRYSYHSCKDRSCPKCHGTDTKRWLAKRRKELLAVPYFHVTCTLPQGLRRIARANQEKLYAILMTTAAEALQKLGLEAARPVLAHLCPCCKKGVMMVIEILPRRARSPPWQRMRGAEGQSV